MTYKYVRLANLLKKQIAMHPPGACYKLPTEKELCNTYGVSRQTVRRALALLVHENLIDKRQGSGSYSAPLVGKAKTIPIPILISNDEEYIYPALLSDITSRLKKAGFRSKIYRTGNQISTERDILNELLSQPLPGLIVEGVRTAFPNPNIDLYERLFMQEIPVLFINSYYTNLKHAILVGHDDADGGRILGNYLAAQGHKMISGIFKSDTREGLSRYYGLAGALLDSGLPVADSQIAWFDSTEVDALRQQKDTRFLTAFIHKQLISCTAVVCHDDEIAYWLIRELMHAGFSIPGQISVVSFDNSYLSTLSQVPLTSLAHSPGDMGRAIAETILQMMQNGSASPQPLPWHLITRSSVCPPSS